MQISPSDTKARLVDLERPAEMDEEAVRIPHGRPAARSVPAVLTSPGGIRPQPLLRLQLSAAQNMHRDTEAARSQDFLYGDDGLPR